MKRRIEVLKCSIVETGADVVVNASNDSATLGGGVSRALFEACGGKVLQDEMRAKLEEEFDGVLDEGDCMVTSAGTAVSFRYVLHVPAVDYRGPRNRLTNAGVERTVTSPARIVACTIAALEAAATLATKENVTLALAFPLLGAGAGGVPVPAVGRAMIDGLREFFAETPEAPVRTVFFAVPEPDRHDVMARLVTAAFGAP